MDKTYNTIIDIYNVDDYEGEKNGRKFKIIYVEDKYKRKFSHFVNNKWGKWETFLKPGVRIPVYCVEKDSGRDEPYRNIYPDRANPKPVDKDGYNIDDKVSQAVEGKDDLFNDKGEIQQ